MSATTLRNRTPPTTVVHIAACGASLAGELTIPDGAIGLAVFSRTNANRRSRRDVSRLASALRSRGYATLVFDLLTPGEEMLEMSTRGQRGDLALLARRLIDTIDWVATQPAIAALPIGLVGEGAGAPAAFVAARVRANRICAVVSHGQRPDLASPVFGRVLTPALFVVPDDEPATIRANELAFQRLRGVKELVRFAGERPTFEPTLDELSRLVLVWFEHYVAGDPVC